jgi:hypothetical protein
MLKLYFMHSVISHKICNLCIKIIHGSFPKILVQIVHWYIGIFSNFSQSVSVIPGCDHITMHYIRDKIGYFITSTHHKMACVILNWNISRSCPFIALLGGNHHGSMAVHLFDIVSISKMWKANRQQTMDEKWWQKPVGSNINSVWWKSTEEINKPIYTLLKIMTTRCLIYFISIYDSDEHQQTKLILQVCMYEYYFSDYLFSFPSHEWLKVCINYLNPEIIENI